MEDPYDYCIISDDSSDRDKARAAGGARPKGLFDGSLDSIDSLVLSPENMVSSGKNNPSSRYQVMVVGVGYEDDSLQKDLGDTIDHFERVFQNFNIDFSYLNVPAPITIVTVKNTIRLPNNDEADLLFSKLNEIITIDRLMFILNTSKYGGSADLSSLKSTTGVTDIYPMVAGQFKKSRTRTHELAHSMGLSDGYNRFYKEDSFGGSELFRYPHELYYPVIRSLLGVNPEIGSTGNTCNGEPAFNFYPNHFNIMGPNQPNEEYLGRVNQGLPVFNPLQAQMMKDTIKETLANRAN